MTGRGRTRKEKSPGTLCAGGKTTEKATQTALPRCAHFPEKQNETTKEQKPNKREPKKPHYSEEKPSVQKTRKERETNNFTEELNKPERSPTHNTMAPVQGAKAKTCAARTKPKATTVQPDTPTDTKEDSSKTKRGKKCSDSTKSSEEHADKLKTQLETKSTTKTKMYGGKVKAAGEMNNMQPETPKDTTKALTKTTKLKTCGGKAKLKAGFAEETTTMQAERFLEDKTKMQLKPFAEEITEMQPQTLKDNTKASKKTTEAKICAGKAKSSEECTEEVTKLQLKTCEESLDERFDEASVDSVLHKTLKTLKIKRNDRSNAAEVINEIIKNIIKHLKENTQCFREVGEPLRTGSYYENLKISHPDEFDVMIPMLVDRVNIEAFGDDGAFYSVALKREKNPLKKFQEVDTLSASKMLDEFRGEVKKCVKKFSEWTVTGKKKGCPAVTLTTNVQSVTISLDVVLSLEVKSSWPPFTKDGLKIEGWLGTKVKQEFKRKPYYLVPKYEGSGTVEKDGVLAKDVWRVSFSHIEKAILRSHGSEKTCCEKGGACCCRKDCLKLLKHLLSLLKEKNSSFDKFCSYHAKTTLFHACCSRTSDADWKASNLGHCFQLLLEDFVGHLESGVLRNFFIPSQNLLSGPSKMMCKTLAACIKKECDNGFPTFKQQCCSTN